MTPKQTRFVQEYLIDLNATQAAIRAGYSAKTATEQGSRLLTNVKVQAAVQEAQAATAERTEVTVDRVVNELALIAFNDIGNYLTMEDGKVGRLDWSKLPPGATKCIQEITQEEHTGGRGHDTGETRRTKFKLYSKKDALDLLGKHLGMFDDKSTFDGTLNVIVKQFSEHRALEAVIEHETLPKALPVATSVA